MKAAERKKAIAAYLEAQKRAVPGGALAEKFGVSRQIIVQDITNLKEMGYEILPTHRGYLFQKSPLAERTFKVYHSTEQTEDELTAIVQAGGTVVDVFVWHKVYGKIAAPLSIDSAHSIQAFLDGVRTGKSKELMHVTGGYHYHTVRAETEEILNEVEKVLTEKGYLVPEA